MSTATQTEHAPSVELSEAGQWTRQTPGPALDTPELGRPSTRRLPTRTLLKIFGASFSFFVAGVNDGSLGAIIPYVIREYNVNTAIVSSVYGATLAGWFFAAATNTHMSQYLDTGPMIALGAAAQVVAHALRAWDPPFGLFVTTFFLVAVGQAYNDTHANTFVATVESAHRWLAVIHASYMAGSLAGPFVATAVASAGSNDEPTWYLFYIFPVGIGLMNLGLIMWAFRDTMGVKTQAASTNNDVEHARSMDGPSRNKDALALIKSTLARPSVWLLSMFYFFYIGSAITSNGWVVEYLVQVRGGDLSSVGYVPAGFNGGCLLGRLLLAEPTYRFGERLAIFIFCCMAVILQIVFWLIIAAAVAISFIGFFTGPLFATGISLASKLFPPEIHASALGFVFVVSQMGGALFPIVTGLVASSVGVGALQPILVGILAATTVSWLLVPRPKASANPGLHKE